MSEYVSVQDTLGDLDTETILRKSYRKKKKKIVNDAD